MYEEDHIVECRPIVPYQVWLRFEDGFSGIVDLSDLKGVGIFKSWDCDEFFQSVHINPESKTIEWGDSIDLDPSVLRNDIKKSTHSKDKK